jgi:hypothetical protein
MKEIKNTRASVMSALYVYYTEEKKLREKHSMQLGLYSLAIKKIFGKEPSEVKIYSLPLGDTISVF